MAKRKEEENVEVESENLKYDLSKIDSAILSIKKELSEDTVIDVGVVTEMPRTPTRSPTIGYIFGSGGTPHGKIIELYGPESSGKTLVAENIMADFQREGKFVAMVDAEFSFDAKYAQVQGLDVSKEKFALFQPNCGEDAFTIVEKLASTGQVSCITVDSIASLVPTAEMNGEMTDQQMGAQARMIGKGLRKVAGICSKNKCTLIVLNQLRMKIGVIFGNPECVTPDTYIDIDVSIDKMKMEDLFKKANLNYVSMEKNIPYDISDFNLKIKSYNHEKNEIEYKKILSVVRKDDSEVYELKNGNNTLLRCTSNHRIFNPEINDYIYIGDVKSGFAQTESGETIPFEVFKTDEVSPILDLEVEDNENYFSNGILSHNTTPGGLALKFWASIRCEVRKGEKDEGEKDEDVIGIKARIKNVKNKTSIPFRKGEIFISFKDGIDVYGEYVDFAVSMGIVQKGGAWFTVNGNRLQGKANVVKFLKDNNEAFEIIKEKVDSQLSGNPTIEVELPETIEESNSISSLADQALN